MSDLARKVHFTQQVGGLLEGLSSQLMDKPAALLRLKRIVAQYSGWHWSNVDPARAASPPAIGQLGRIRMPTLIIIGERTTADMHKLADILQEIPQALTCKRKDRAKTPVLSYFTSLVA